jgi:hypothetical protein
MYCGEIRRNMTDSNASEIFNPEEIGMKKFEVRTRPAKGGGLENAVFIGGELLDWQVNLNSLMEASKMGAHYMREVQRDIERHFVESVSDFLGRKVTAEDIKVATKTGWI